MPLGCWANGYSLPTYQGINSSLPGPPLPRHGKWNIHTASVQSSMSFPNGRIITGGADYNTYKYHPVCKLISRRFLGQQHFLSTASLAGRTDHLGT